MTMQLSLTIDGIREDLRKLTALGDEATAAAGERITAALGPIATVRLLEILGQAAVEISSQRARGHVELRVAGDEASLVVMAEEERVDAPDDADTSARITLRLPEQLKIRIEEAASRDGASTNTWIVRALARATSGDSATQHGIRVGGLLLQGLPGHRLRGSGST